MLAAVDDLLGGERLDLLGQLGRRALSKGADALDKKGFSDGKGRRQRIVERRRHGIASVPPASGTDLVDETPVARCDGEISRGHACGGHH